MLNYQHSNHYTYLDDSLDYAIKYTPTTNTGRYTTTMVFLRVNSYGYGVNRLKKVALRNRITVSGANVTITEAVTVVEKNDKIIAVFDLIKQIAKAQLQVTEMYNNTPDTAGSGSAVITLYAVSENNDYSGFISRATLLWYVRKLYDAKYNGGAAPAATAAITNDIGIRMNAQGGAYTTLNAGKFKTSAKNFILAALPVEREKGLSDEAILKSLTYFQLQYYIIKAEYLDAETAEAYCKENYSWCQPPETEATE